MGMEIFCFFTKIRLASHRRCVVRAKLFLKNLTELVILCLNLEVALWVVADWAYCRSLLAHADVATVCTLPDAIAVT